MKKLIAVLVATLAAFTLSGCGSSTANDAAKDTNSSSDNKNEGKEDTNIGEEVLVASFEMDGVEITQKYNAIGDKATKLTQIGTIDTTVFDEATIETMRDTSDTTRAAIEKIEGAGYEMQENDGIITETITLSFEDPEVVKDIIATGLLPAEAPEGRDVSEITEISIQATKASLEAQGFTIEKAPEE